MPVFPDGSGMIKTMAELGWTPKFALVIRAPEGVNWGEDREHLAIMSPFSLDGITLQSLRVWTGLTNAIRKFTDALLTC